jgi:uncharacterized protein YsxB (DUF464 family)
MTKITVFRNQNQQIMGFSCIGHAGFAYRGRDVVCAGISILVQNTINAIEAYTEEGFSCEADQKTGDIRFRFKNPPEHDAELLINAMILGLEGIQSSYGKKFLKLQFEEV